MRNLLTLSDADNIDKGGKTSQSNAVAQLCGRVDDQNHCDELRFCDIVGMLNPPFVELFEQLFRDDGFWNLFLTGPSSLNGHHCGTGGNLRHSIEVAETAARIAYGSLDLLDGDVLITGALLHDVGKATDYTSRIDQGWEMTDEGRMLGHKVTGSMLVEDALSKVSGITPAQKLGLLNCLISSNYGHELRPQQCFEAECISRADQSSASADLYRRSALLQKNKPGFGQAHRHQTRTILHIRTSVDMDANRDASRFGAICTKKN